MRLAVDLAVIVLLRTDRRAREELGSDARDPLAGSRNTVSMRGDKQLLETPWRSPNDVAFTQ
jgi:hypothetical protein